MFFEDDTNLKIVLWIMLILSVIVLIGLWELFVKPGGIWIWQFIGPYISQVWYMVFK